MITSLAEKSLLLTEGDGAPRYRMLDTIKEYAGHRLAEAGESDLARHAHLAYFTELTETAEPHLRRAEQLEWLATLEADHDNIGSAMRGALAAGEAHAAMRLAAGAGWYWWLGGHRSEGFELLVAATKIPGEVTDEIRAMVYALVVNFVTSGRGDGSEAAEWIHQAYRFSQRSQPGNPLLALVAPLERMLQAPGDFLSAWEPVLDNEDPWVRALARLQLGKMQIMLGQGGREADANLELALAEFRALGERFGISFALSELAERIATRGEFAGACELLRTGDRGRHRSRCHRGCHPDAVATGPAVLAARRSGLQRGCHRRRRAVRRTGHLAACAGRAGSLEGGARALGRPRSRRPTVSSAPATTLLGDEAERADIRAVTHDLLGYLAADLEQARARPRGGLRRRRPRRGTRR